MKAFRLVASTALAAAMVALCAPIASSAEVTALMDGRPLGLRRVARHHCHDAAFPVIRCFHDAGARDRDAARASARAVGPKAAFYVQVFEHENYGGASFSIATSITNLGSVGWNDAVTSFKSLNGGRPKFWEHAGYSGGSWQWTAGAWVANVGAGANDRFTSIKNVP